MLASIEGPSSSSGKKTRKEKTISATINSIVMLFMSVILYKYITTGHFYRFTTMERFVDNCNTRLLVHIVCGNVWAIAFNIQQKPQQNSGKRKIHKWVGYTALLAVALLCTTGYRMSMQLIQDEFDGPFRFTYPSVDTLNVFAASASNNYLLGMAITMIAISMTALLSEHDVQKHRVFMIKVHGSFVLGILPRFGAFLFRLVFPCFSAATNYSLACMSLMWYNIQILRKQSKTPHGPAMWSMHWWNLFLTALFVAIEVCLGFPSIVLPIYVTTVMTVGIRLCRQLKEQQKMRPHNDHHHHDAPQKKIVA